MTIKAQTTPAAVDELQVLRQIVDMLNVPAARRHTLTDAFGIPDPVIDTVLEWAARGGYGVRDHRPRGVPWASIAIGDLTVRLHQPISQEATA